MAALIYPEQKPIESGFSCLQCEEPIHCADEAVELHVLRLARTHREVHAYAVGDEDTGTQYDPQVFCFNCWEDIYDDVRTEAKDSPPVVHPLGVIECCCCKSSICEDENAGAIVLGEYHLSRRGSRADGNRAAFGAIGKTEFLCLYCLTAMNDVVVTMWDDLGQFDECADCIHARCWRVEGCVCACHHHDIEDTNE